MYLNTNYEMITGLFELRPLDRFFPFMAASAMGLGVGSVRSSVSRPFRDICAYREEENRDEEPKNRFLAFEWAASLALAVFFLRMRPMPDLKDAKIKCPLFRKKRKRYRIP